MAGAGKREERVEGDRGGVDDALGLGSAKVLIAFAAGTTLAMVLDSVTTGVSPFKIFVIVLGIALAAYSLRAIRRGNRTP